LTLTVFKRGGKYTEAIHELKKGDAVFFRGPYGNGFSIPKKAKNLLLVAGGYGVVPLYFLAQEARKQKKKATLVIGARTKTDLILINQFKKLGCRVVACTDDGSFGMKGYSTDAAYGLMQGEKFDQVYAVGPEIMMAKLVRNCADRKTPIECSLERYMKCGFGVCGQCAVDGLLVCKDGPVFSGTVLSKLRDFGKFHRGPSGKLEKL